MTRPADLRDPAGLAGRRRLAPTAALLISLLLPLACSGGDGRGDGPPPGAGGSAGCTATADDQLVLLSDDRRSQNSENVVPVVRTSALQPPLRAALDAVSRALSQDELQGLNRAVSVDRTDAPTAAQNFVRRLAIGQGLSGGRGPVVVGAAGFSESEVLANVYATVLRQAGYSAVVQTMATREVLEPALESGDVQVTPEYAATLTEFLAGRASSPTKPSNDIAQTLAALRPLAEARGLTVLDPAAANNQNAYAVTRSTAERLGVTTLSQLAAKCPGGVSLGGPPECPQRPFCQPALERTYGLKITQFQALDADGPRTRQALRQGGVTLGLVFSSDADVLSAD